MEKTGIYGGFEIRDFIKNFSEWTVISQYLKQYFPYLLAGGLAVIAAYVLITRRLFRLVPVRIEE